MRPRHRGKFLAVLGVVDILSGSAKESHAGLVETQGRGCWESGRRWTQPPHADSRIKNVEDALERKLVEIETVTDVIVGRYSLRIIVHHHGSVTLLADGVEAWTPHQSNSTELPMR